MNNKLKEIFRGKVVNKAHTINTGVDEFPRYVLEYLIDRLQACLFSFFASAPPSFGGSRKPDVVGVCGLPFLP